MIHFGQRNGAFHRQAHNTRDRRVDTIVVRTKETISSALLIQKGALPKSKVCLGLKTRNQPPINGPKERPRLAQACMRPRTRPCQYLFTEREANPFIVGLMKEFPTAIPAPTKSSAVSVCTSGNEKILQASSATPVSAIPFSVKFLINRPIIAPWTITLMTPTPAKI